MATMRAPADPADLEEAFFDEGLGDLERRRALERAGRVGADIEIDLQDKGPLFSYVQARRHEAAEALRILVSADPKDAVGIAVAQMTVMEYLRACDWIGKQIERADEAERIIKGEYQDGDERNDDGE